MMVTHFPMCLAVKLGVLAECYLDLKSLWGAGGVCSLTPTLGKGVKALA